MEGTKTDEQVARELQAMFNQEGEAAAAAARARNENTAARGSPMGGGSSSDDSARKNRSEQSNGRDNNRSMTSLLFRLSQGGSSPVNGTIRR